MTRRQTDTWTQPFIVKDNFSHLLTILVCLSVCLCVTPFCVITQLSQWWSEFNIKMPPFKYCFKHLNSSSQPCRMFNPGFPVQGQHEKKTSRQRCRGFRWYNIVHVPCTYVIRRGAAGKWTLIVPHPHPHLSATLQPNLASGKDFLGVSCPPAYMHAIQFVTHSVISETSRKVERTTNLVRNARVLRRARVYVSFI